MVPKSPDIEAHYNRKACKLEKTRFPTEILKKQPTQKT